MEGNGLQQYQCEQDVNGYTLISMHQHQHQHHSDLVLVPRIWNITDYTDLEMS